MAVKIRLAALDDAPDVARLLDDFNSEFHEFTPGVAALTERAARMLSEDQATFLLTGEGPDGIAELRFRASIWSGALDAHLEELYVVPPLRGQGIGRALLEAAMAFARKAGATRIDLGTSVEDTVAITLYEGAGFTNHEGRADGPRMLYYEREL